jgi:hypothetical protein
LTIRLTVRQLILGAALAAGLAFLLVLPFIRYNRAFLARLRTSQAKWDTLGSSNYEIVVASNSLTRCTGGWNTIRVREGGSVQGSNSERGTCARDEFVLLTVEALFARIWQECVFDRPLWRPFPTCNVAYDEQLGYPRRLDTYTFAESGEYLPSVTVERVTLE